MRYVLAMLMTMSFGCDKGAAPATPANAAPAAEAKAPASQAAPKPATLETLLAEPNVVLLDVRTEGEWKASHIKGARHLALSSIDNISTLVADKTTPIVAHCLSGARSGRATDILRRKGYTRVVNGGGFKALSAKAKRELE
jgi:phage shock protein E